MKKFSALPLVLLTTLACSTPRGSASIDEPAASGASAAPASKPSFEAFGLLTAMGGGAIAVWPEQYAGSLVVLSVRPHGSLVKEGEVVAEVDTRAIDDELHKAELEARSATVRHQGTVERNRLDDAAASSELARARAALERAQRGLDGWKKHELAFQKRQDEIGKRYEQSNVEDQTDELDQLEKMYKADTLVDATEDIVLKRSRRQLDTTKVSNQLSRDRATYRETLDIVLQTEQREEQVRAQVESVARLAKQQEIDAVARRDAEARSADSLREAQERLARLTRDREQLALRAPRAGVLLHGSARDMRPGKSAARVDRGADLQKRQDLFQIVDSDPNAVVFEVNDAQLARIADGARVRVQALGGSSASGVGVVHIEPFPRSTSATDTTYEARVELDRGLTGAVPGSRARIVLEPSAQVQG